MRLGGLAGGAIQVRMLRLAAGPLSVTGALFACLFAAHEGKGFTRRPRRDTWDTDELGEAVPCGPGREGFSAQNHFKAADLFLLCH